MFFILEKIKIIMAQQMSPEEASQFVEQCNKEFANRYSSKDMDYEQVSNNVGKSQPPLIIPKVQSNQRNYDHQNYHHNNHHRSHHRDNYYRR